MKIVNLIDAGFFELKNAGDTEKDIEKVFEKIDLSDLTLEDMIKQGLKYLSRN